jgi:hypothetical protein
VLATVLLVGTTAGCTAPDPTSGPSPTTSATSRAAASAQGEPTSAPAPGPPTTGSSAGDGSAAGLASELLPAQPPGPTGLPDAVAPGPSLTGPLPATGTSNGAVVTGFPTTVIPIADGLTVVSSSVSASGHRLQVGLQASSDSPPAEVQAAYVAALGGAGFAVAESPAVPGSTATAFTRGPDGLVLTVTERLGGGTELTIAGTLTTAG